MRTSGSLPLPASQTENLWSAGRLGFWAGLAGASAAGASGSAAMAGHASQRGQSAAAAGGHSAFGEAPGIAPVHNAIAKLHEIKAAATLTLRIVRDRAAGCSGGCGIAIGG